MKICLLSANMFDIILIIFVMIACVNILGDVP